MSLLDPPRSPLAARATAVLHFINCAATQTLLGWRDVALRVGSQAKDLVLELSYWQIAFLAFQLLGFLAAVPGWIVYESTLIGRPGVVGSTAVGVEWKLLFLFVPLAGLILGCCRVPFRRLLFLVPLMVLLGTLAAGFAAPGRVHTDMVAPGDFRFSAWIYIHTAAMLGSAVVFHRAFQEGGLTWQQTRAWLLTSPTDKS